MKLNSTPLVALLLVGAAISTTYTFGCSSDNPLVPGNTNDSGEPDSAALIDGATDGGAEASAPGKLPAPTCLDASVLAPYGALAADFPFCVTRFVTTPAAVDIRNPRWGKHGGPSTNDTPFSAAAPITPPKLTRYTLPAGATGAAAKLSVELTSLSKSIAPVYFWGIEVGDTPAGGLLASYTTSKPANAGEVLLLNPSGTNVDARAFVNGFYSGAVTTASGKSVLVYAGLSELSTTEKTTNSNGLYLTTLCGNSYFNATVASDTVKACDPVSRQSLSWKGLSGPVALDGNGNALVAAAIADADPAKGTAEIYGLNIQTALTAAAPTPGVALAKLDTNYVSSFGAAWERGQSSGFAILVNGNTPGLAPLVLEYAASASGVTGGKSGMSAILPNMTVTALAFFTAPDGVLWMSITTAAADAPPSAFVELRRKP
jgi:hypothetical protein